MYKIRKVIFEDVELEPAAVITIADAARLLGMSGAGVVRAIERGALVGVVDTEKLRYRGSTMVLVESMSAYRTKRAQKNEEKRIQAAAGLGLAELAAVGDPEEVDGGDVDGG